MVCAVTEDGGYEGGDVADAVGGGKVRGGVGAADCAEARAGERGY